MSVTLSHNIDEIQLQNLIDAGYEELRLYYSNGPEGPWVLATITASPSTLALLLAADLPYTTTIIFSDGNAAMWFKVVPYGSGPGYGSLSDSDSFHGDGGTTLAYLRKRLGRQTKDLISGTTTAGGSTTTAICTSFNFTRFIDDHFVNWYFHNLSNGDVSLITGFVKSTGTFTFSPAITSVDSSVSFEVTRMWTPEEYREAINWGIVNLYPILSKTYVDTSIRTQLTDSGDNTYELQFKYDVPSSIRRVSNVEIETDSTIITYNERGHPWRPVPFEPYYINLERGFEIKVSLPDDRRLRVTGEGLHDLLYEDTDYVDLVDPEINLLIYLAASNLYALLPVEAASSDIDRYERMSKYYLGLYGEFRDKHKVARPHRKFWSPQNKWRGTNR